LKENTNDILTLPVLALRGLTAMPNSALHFEVIRKKSILAIEAAMNFEQTVFIVTQQKITDTEPEFSNLYSIGTIAKIKQVLKAQPNVVKVMIEGLARGRMINALKAEPYLEAEIEILEDEKSDYDIFETEAMIRQAQEAFDSYAQVMPKVPSEFLMKVITETEPGRLADFMLANTPLKYDAKQKALECLNPLKRLELTIKLLNEETQILAIEREIGIRVHEQMEQNQREYYMREQIKALQSELGEGDSVYEQAEEYYEKIYSTKMPEECTEKLIKEVERFEKLPFASQESSVIRTYLETCLELPWGYKTKETSDIIKAQEILDKDHYGLFDVKERIIEFLSVKQLTGNLSGQILCLVGPPGVGKTSIATSVARATGRKFARISLGGVRDEAEIRGHRKTYIGSMPGRIINALKLAKSSNPVILLDEIDKLGNDYKGDPSSALLEVLDPEQNKNFRDHYLELPYDLSDVLFITTANTIDTIPKPLLDRMEIIELNSYTNNEKLQIAIDYLVPKQLKKNGLNKTKLKIDADVLPIVIDSYTRESGVRELERQINKLCRKAAKQIVTGKKQIKITPNNLEQFLGSPRYKPDKLNEKGSVGVATGLAYTSVGGETLEIEVNVMEGTGKIELTGSLGDVMKESARAAVSYIRANAEKLGVEKEFYKNKDIHIHVPEGAVPKDGPSAGITIASAVLSAFTGRAVRGDTAMTGEITLRGRVLPIGGLKEKTMAAYKLGIKNVIIPEKNVSDLQDIDQTVRKGLNFIPVSDVSEVFDFVICKKKEELVLTHDVKENNFTRERLVQ